MIRKTEMDKTTGQEERYRWLRLLDGIQQENIDLKNRLAELIKNEVGAKVLEKAEYYQNQFLNKDTVIALLRHDIVKQNQLDSDIVDYSWLSNKHERLRRDVELMEKEFTRLKTEFNKYILNGSLGDRAV